MQNNFFRLIFSATALLLALVSGAQSNVAVGGKLNLVGTTGPYADSLWAAIIEPQKGSYVGEPARITNGGFKISTSLPQTGLYVLMVGNPANQATLRYFNIFLQNEQVEITVPQNAINLSVQKGETPKAFNALVDQMGPEFDTLSILNKMRESAGTYGYSADSIATARLGVVSRLEQKIPGYLKQYNATAVAPFLLNLAWPLNFPIQEMDGWVKMIDPKAMENEYGNAIRQTLEVEKVLGYGQAAPVFVQNDTEGRPVSLESFKGKYVLIDFWASWCGPCRRENPNVVNAYEKYKAKNFTVLGVSLDKDKSRWVQAISDDKLHWTQVSDLGYWNNEVAKLYRVQSIPQNYLLDPEGKIIGKNLRGEELNGFLEKVLANN